MGTLDSYKYPEHGIEKAVEITETIHNKGITQPEILADQLGHSSAKGGAFRNKLTSLRRYGLISGSGDIQLTDLAEKIVAPRPGSSERQDAMAQAINNVDILEKLYERLEYDLPDDGIWYHLVEITGCDRSEAQDKADDISDLYEEGLPYVREARESEQRQSAGATGGGADSPSSTLNQISEFPEDADAVLITPDARIGIRSRATYVAAKALFEDIGQKYERDSSDPDGNLKQEELTDML